MIPVRAVTTTSRAAAAPKQVRTKAVLSPLFLRFRTDNERTSNGGVVFRDKRNIPGIAGDVTLWLSIESRAVWLKEIFVGWRPDIFGSTAIVPVFGIVISLTRLGWNLYFKGC